MLTSHEDSHFDRSPEFFAAVNGRRATEFGAKRANSIRVGKAQFAARIRMEVRQNLYFCRLGALLLLLPCYLIAQPDRIVAPINAQAAVLLKGSLNPRATSAHDRGSVEASLKVPAMTLMFKRTEAQETDLQRLLQEQQDPASPSFRRWLTPEQYADRFGISAADMDRIVSWLQSEKFSVGYAARGRSFVLFSGSADQVKATFRTEIHHYSVGAESHYAAASEPTIPAALDSVVLGIRGMDDFYPNPGIFFPSPGGAVPNAWGLVAGDIRAIYDTNFFATANQSLNLLGIDGAGQSVVVVGQTEIGTSDINSYYSEYTQVGAGLQFIPVPGPHPVVDPPSSCTTGTACNLGEGTLDVDMVAAIAPLATVYYVYSSNAFDAATYAIDNLIAPVISMSFSLCETQTATATAQGYRMLAQQATSLGITWVAASGDTGAFACDTAGEPHATMGVAVNLPASIPEVTAVGGTELDTNLGPGCGGTSTVYYLNWSNQPNGTSTNCYIPEVVWNDTPQLGLAASGGGGSILFPAPTWQVGLAGLDTYYNAQLMRGVPDVAFAASSLVLPYEILFNGLKQTGGTSAATPVFAGIIVLLNQYLMATGLQAKPGLGNINPALYQLAKIAPGVFHDITSGNNRVPYVCTPGTPGLCSPGSFGYDAGPGYDLVTGLGSFDALSLITAWPAIASAPVITSLNPNSAVVRGNAFQLIVNGSGFASADAVRWDGMILPTVFVSTTQLSASVSANLITSPGTAFITVGGAGGGATSAPTSFTIGPSVQQGTAFVTSITNAASGISGAVSPGEIITIKGSGLGPTNGVSSSVDPITGVFDTALVGTSVFFSVVDPAAIVQMPAPITYTSATQINAIVPYGLAVGSEVVVTVEYQTLFSTTLTTTSLQVVGATPGIFTVDATGSGQAAVVNEDGTLNQPSNPAPKGSIVAIYATGEGLTNPSGIDGKPATAPYPAPVLPVVVGINNQGVPVLYAGAAPGEVAGLMQVNIRIPSNSPSGNVPISLSVGGAFSQGGVTVSIR